MTALDRFRAGGVIPAHPLALDDDRKLDERRQRALSRYYVEAGATGLAVAVHTTQFAVHEPGRGLLAPVLELAAETAAEYPEQAPVLVTGIVGPTEQAVAEAELARDLGYDLALLTPYGTGDASEDDLLARARAVGEVIPVIGFYLQPAVGGRVLGRDFWRRLAEQPAVTGVKVAPFDRYATLEVVHGLALSGRAGDIALYTGNDDHIVMDLLTTYELDGQRIEVVGGLLGQWAVWVRGAVDVLAAAGRARAGDDAALRELLALNPVLTDANAAIFDAAHGFHGCVPGIHEVLRRQGLLAGLWCLDEAEVLSPGQLNEIDRIWAAYPQLRDDEFIAERLDRWLGP
ncbi:dihydrodipicolinate synthase family protein [Jiangella alkaliphila]|uniref:Dihydrodipicolinate synthase/N-acetylneuraminate lyase n=1 Tax=Jiangella alkaliphila TaxID=419479 RepID=A0A1H2KW88_9ACTN|nr:dihydrodipicolinate synthase family protein [Jiangella alkaliphila]SDU72734.1 Dihydrodipicolinate synthase/N-acetylneuraminate lyase [Jiangella alkaliphila]